MFTVGAIEVVLVIPLVVVYRSLAVLLAGLLAVAGTVFGIWADLRRHPRWLAIVATVGGQEVELFASRDQAEVGRVWRALIRATEAARGLPSEAAESTIYSSDWTRA